MRQVSCTPSSWCAMIWYLLDVDFRSFDNNFEANIFFYDQDLALRIKDVFLEDATQSVLLKDTPEWTNRKILTRLWESLTRMLSPLF